MRQLVAPLTTFQQIHERAAQRKCAAWQTYTPLSPSQLEDDDPADSESVRIDMTIVLTHWVAAAPLRSTTANGGLYRQVRIVRRPTEWAAFRHITHSSPIDDEPLPLRADTRPRTRYCILCHEHHPISAFVRSHRYLHGLSYICKAKLQSYRHGRWLLAG